MRNHFLVIGWDVENSDYHDALQSALRSHISLEYMSDFISKKVSIASIILPVAHTIYTFMCLRGSITSKDVIANFTQVEIELEKAIEDQNKLIALENRNSSEDDVGPEKMQKRMANDLGDRDYDAFFFNEHDLLKDKIAFALGLPQTVEKYDSKSQTKIDSLYNIIKKQSSK